MSRRRGSFKRSCVKRRGTRKAMYTSLSLDLSLLEHFRLKTDGDGFAGLRFDGVSGVNRCRDGIVLVNVRQRKGVKERKRKRPTRI
jgi:hypothetical protein